MFGWRGRGRRQGAPPCAAVARVLRPRAASRTRGSLVGRGRKGRRGGWAHLDIGRGYQSGRARGRADGIASGEREGEGRGGETREVGRGKQGLLVGASLLEHAQRQVWRVLVRGRRRVGPAQPVEAGASGSCVESGGDSLVRG